MRDSQRSKVYGAESLCNYAADERDDAGGTVMYTPDAIKRMVQEIRKDDRVLAKYKVPMIDFKFPEKRATAFCRHYAENHRELTFPAWSRHRAIVLHEVAHALVSWNFPGHGKEFAACLLDLYRWFGSEDAASCLEQAYTSRKVDFDITPETLARKAQADLRWTMKQERRPQVKLTLTSGEELYTHIEVDFEAAVVRSVGWSGEVHARTRDISFSEVAYVKYLR